MTLQVLINDFNQGVGRSGLTIFGVVRLFCGKYIQGMKIPGRTRENHIWVVFHWDREILTKMLKTCMYSEDKLAWIGLVETLAVAPNGAVEEIYHDSSCQDLLDTHCKLFGSAIGEYHEFHCYFFAFPWAFIGLLSTDAEER